MGGIGRQSMPGAANGQSSTKRERDGLFSNIFREKAP